MDAMNKKNFFLKLSGVFCGSAVLILCAWHPLDFLQELQVRYDRYKEKYPAVKINMIFNQPTFTPGDTAFFCAWYLNEELLPVKGNHVITLDLLGGEGRTYQKIRFKVQNGKGYNQIVFRKDLPPAEYSLVAYSDWMKNFGDTWLFQKKIQLVSKKQINITKKQEDPVRFYPEGGNLIEGIVNHVAVRGPLATELVVTDQTRIEIARVLLDSTGFGSFAISPKPNQSYMADWPAGKTWALPEVKKDGVSVRIETGEHCEVHLSVPPNSQWTNRELYAIVNSMGKILTKQKVTIQPDQPFHLQILKQERSDALHQLFVFDSEGNMLAQRLFVPYDMKNVEVKMQLPAEVKQRESIPCTFEVVDGAGNYLESDLRIRVFQERLFKNQSWWSDFHMSDLPEVAERAEKFGRKHQASLNNFLITQKWKRINWEAVLKDKTIDLRFSFQSQPKLKGQVLSKTNGQPAPDSTIIVSYLQNNNVGFEAYAKNGEFEVPFIFDFWGEDLIFCTLQYKSKNVDDNYVITILRDSVTISENWSSLENAENSLYAEYTLSKSLVSKSYSFFGSNQKRAGRQDQTANSIIEEEFLGADYGINVADYVVFPNMEDLLREVVPFVQSRKKGLQYSVRISFRLETSTRVFNDDPLYVIDGTMTRNTSVFMDLKPENLVSIKVINNPNKLAQLSRLGENGIIFVQTKKGDFSDSRIKQNLFPVVGLSRASDSFKMNYSKVAPPARVPDLRSTLYWNPLLETDRTGHAEMTFFASDDIGPMKVLVQGLTKDGRPFSASHEIKVVFNPTLK